MLFANFEQMSGSIGMESQRHIPNIKKEDVINAMSDI